MKTTLKSLLCVAMGCALLTSCGSKKDDKMGGMKEELPIVKVETVTDGTVDAVSEYTATVEAFKSNNITSATGNRIKRILVDVGSHVRAGQAVVILDDVTIDQQRIAIDQQRIALANQKRDLDRAKELVKIGGGTQQTVDQLQAQYDAQARAIDASNRSLRNMQENTVLTSPISGVVTARNYDNGDLPVGQPILVIEQQQPLKVIVKVNESDFPKVKVGLPVNVRFDTYEGESFSGQVHLIHPTIDPNTRTFEVEVTINNRDNKVHSGMFARVIFNFGSHRSVVLSDRAIQKQTGSGLRYVYTLESNGTVKFREVQLGRRLENRYEVTGGLSPGMKVVTSGQSRLSDGAKVEVQQ
ncbi:MAG: efflux RND transporter periplasmic adaptor subunit [Muribaculaceae bacterium]|nr:efflux RND transporter periplasmic adaptor subunit [Muribaculaceae bacterium]